MYVPTHMLVTYVLLLLRMLSQHEFYKQYASQARMEMNPRILADLQLYVAQKMQTGDGWTVSISFLFLCPTFMDHPL